MSQSGSVDSSINVLPPDVPLEFITDNGNAVPIANQLEILGDTQLAGVTPVETTGSGNTVTVVVQLAQSNAFSSATTAGLATFDSASFGVDANGFVTFSGSMGGVESFNVDASSPPGTDPVLPDGLGVVTMTGRQVPSLGVGAQVLRSNSLAVNSITYEIQQAGANAIESTNFNGVAHFDSSQFTVSNGFVSITGGVGVTSVTGTANRITSSGGATPQIDIDAAYVGQTSITTLGTITTGTWNGTAIGPTFGGTGQTTYATGDILYASAANTLSKLIAGTDTHVLTLAGGVPTWAAGGGGTGDVVGPAGATDTAIAVYDDATGKLIANSIPTIDANGNILTSAALSGATLSIDVVNSSNTASSVARMSTTVAGSTASDAIFQSSVSGGQSWTWGLDNSDDDSFVLAGSVALGTTNVMRVSTAGEINKPLQPAFLAYLNTTVNNVTGDATVYTVIFDTEVYDQNADFNLGTSTFTAPVTGKYYFNFIGLIVGASSITGANGRIVTSNATYNNTMYLSPQSTNSCSVSMAVLADMDAADTTTFSVSTTDAVGGKVSDISGLTSGNLRTYVNGWLGC